MKALLFCVAITMVVDVFAENCPNNNVATECMSFQCSFGYYKECVNQICTCNNCMTQQDCTSNAAGLPNCNRQWHCVDNLCRCY
ncbi:serine protease inhibitor Cvsi-1-like [Ruditapes philippinarum]|uniref:serine protease inhibitor Cvsi-1-like n=1 Tax=Ruditapes philippinarum TaxID=129788 RepID=UPI00295AFFD3|nr:serine protease inhibitor Cvsi-1-like [Ruditapes philippinarum]